LNLTGRILLAHEGINGTLGGTTQEIQAYIKAMRENPIFSDFADIDFKESPGSAACFPRLRIAVREEIVRLGISPTLLSHTEGGQHLTPAQAHAMITENPNLVLLDGRNAYESDVGTFKNAVKPQIENFRDFPAYIDNNLEQFKDKEVLMFCTGGIRCERASAYLKTKNVAKTVYQLEGGIVKYVEQFPDGYFRGKNYVFDARVTTASNNDILGQCYLCKKPCDNITNCLNARCNLQHISCSECLERLENCCSVPCKVLVADALVEIRTKPKKITPQLESAPDFIGQDNQTSKESK
jgi:predicted sulfurtransferase